MTARVLVVDDILANVKLLEARLTAEYFEVMTAMSGAEALDMVAAGHCDIVLLDVMMPGMDGFEVCRRIKANPTTHHIPVVMITALDQPADRVRGLEAGADDFLTKPVDDVSLVTRVRSLVRLKMLTDELRMRAATSRDMGMSDPFEQASKMAIDGGRVLIVDDRPASYDRLRKTLRRLHHVDVEENPQEALFRVVEGNYDVLIVSLDLADFDGLRLCSQIRSLDRTRDMPILIVVDPEDTARLMRGLDMGVNDYALRPVDKNELLARVNTQIRRRRYADCLRDNVQMSMTLAVTDELTGLHNRRYMESHLKSQVRQAQERDRNLSVLVIDIDYFKSINDSYGHDVGDEVLRDFAARLKKNVRGIDLACRVGGEEFVVVMPDTDLALALRIAERLRASVSGTGFVIQNGARMIDVTVSVGVAHLDGADETVETLMKRADVALYSAKQDGRNRVVADAA